MNLAAPTPQIADAILDKALELGEASSWEQVRLHAVAAALGISLAEVRQSYGQKDDLVEAWFDRADEAVLAEGASQEFLDLPGRDRLQHVIMAWLQTLAPHRRLTREMLAYKFEPGHLHLQVLGLLRVSRTVQWFREAACEDATDAQRIFEETTLSTVYLMTFGRWLFDDSPDAARTRGFLARSLRRWDSLGRAFDEFLGGNIFGNRSAREPSRAGPEVVATEFRRTGSKVRHSD